MSQLITKDYVEKRNSYQMPKAFFTDPHYMPMRAESKMAYMLMLDLLPLAEQNNWVNEEGQVFVQLPREEMMKRLNIKGTQKAALVIKELIHYQLIVRKDTGSRGCHEIYLLYP